MNEIEKALFQDANDRSLSTLVPSQPNNAPVGAYPNFVTRSGPAGSQVRQIVILRQRVVESITPFLGSQSPDLQCSESDSIPVVFDRARAFNESLSMPTGRPATQIDPNADPQAVEANAEWISIPTFLIGSRRQGAVSRKTMTLLRLRRSAAANNGIVSFLVPVGHIPLHPIDQGGGNQNLTSADLSDPARVGVVMRAVHAYAVSKGYAAGLPGFATGTQAMLQIMFIKEAEVVEVGQHSGSRAIWFRRQLPLTNLGGNGDGASAVIPGDPSFSDQVATIDAVGPDGLVQMALMTNGTASITTLDPNPGHARAIGWVVSALRRTIEDVLYCDGRLLHLNPASGQSAVVVDGDGVGTHLTGTCGAANCLISREVNGSTELHAFYLYSGPPTGAQATQANTQNLHHARLVNGAWVVEVVDGHVTDSEGRVLTTIGLGLTAVATPDGTIEVFYTDAGSTNLRRCLLMTDGSFTGFTVLDGAGGTPVFGPGTGPTTAHIGGSVTAAVFDGKVHVFYDDNTHGNIRWAFRDALPAGAGQWRYGVLDGNGRSGRTSSMVLGSRAVVWNDVLSVVYSDATRGEIRHAALRRGANLWAFEVVDGPQAFALGGAPARVSGLLGAASVSRGGPPSLPVVISYIDVTNSRLRAAVLDTF